VLLSASELTFFLAGVALGAALGVTFGAALGVDFLAGAFLTFEVAAFALAVGVVVTAWPKKHKYFISAI
jgi:hypothetical protein